MRFHTLRIVYATIVATSFLVANTSAQDNNNGAKDLPTENADAIRKQAQMIGLGVLSSVGIYVRPGTEILSYLLEESKNKNGGQGGSDRGDAPGTGGNNKKAVAPMRAKAPAAYFRTDPNDAIFSALKGKFYSEEVWKKNANEEALRTAAIAGMVEPAVFHNQMMMLGNVSQYVNSQYTSSIEEVLVLANDDPTGELLRQYTSCMSKLRHGQDKKGELAARTTCRNQVKNASEAKKFDEIDNGEDKAYGPKYVLEVLEGKGGGGAQTKGLSLRQNLPGGAPSNNNSADEWRLSQALFTQENGGGNTGNNVFVTDKAQNLKDAFLLYAGDFKFTKEKSPLRWVAEQVAPKEKELIKAVNDNRKNVYKALLDLMKRYCDFKSGQGNGGGKGEKPSKFQQKIFWVTEAKTKDYEDLSMRGFTFTPVMGDAFFNVFQADFDLATDDGKKRCEEIQQAQQKADEGPPSEALEDWLYIYSIYARRVGTGRFLERMMDLQNAVSAYVSRPVEAIYVKRLFDTVLRDGSPDGYRDLSLMMQQNRAETFQLIQDVGVYMQTRVGRGGFVINNRDSSSNMFGNSDTLKGQ